MDLMEIYATQILVAIALVVLFALVMVVRQILRTRAAMKNAEDRRLTPAEGEERAGLLETAEMFAPWTNGEGFDFVDAYATESGYRCFVIVWRHRDYPRWFELYPAGNKSIAAFSTAFGEGRDLTSVRSSLAVLPLPPGLYRQWLPWLPIPDVYARHLEAEGYLARVGSLQYDHTAEYVEIDRQQDRKLSAYVQSLPLWPLRIPYWHYVARYTQIHRTIEEQHKSGRILLPNDEGFREFRPDIVT